MAKRLVYGRQPAFATPCIDIQSPMPDFIVAPGDTLHVSGSLPKFSSTPAFPHAFVGIWPLAETPDSDGVPATVDAGTATYTRDFVAPSTLGLHKIVAKAAQNNNGGVGSGWCPSDSTQSPASRLFTIRRQDSVFVAATQCLWFHNGTVTPGPRGENVANHLPLVHPVPSGAAFVDIVVWPEVQEWQHGTTAGTVSTAAGYRSEQVQDAYVDYAANSGLLISKVSDAEALLNCLVGMFEIDGASSYTQFPVGLRASFEIPAGAVNLLLGHHDGFEWNNNSGSVNVALVWRGADDIHPS